MAWKGSTNYLGAHGLEAKARIGDPSPSLRPRSYGWSWGGPSGFKALNDLRFWRLRSRVSGVRAEGSTSLYV